MCLSKARHFGHKGRWVKFWTNEIEALISKSQTSQTAGGNSTPKSVVPCDLRRTNQLTTDQIVAVTKLHESFAIRVSSSLGAHLRVGIEINLASVEQLSYREFLSRLQDLTYLASLRVMPIDARAALQILALQLRACRRSRG